MDEEVRQEAYDIITVISELLMNTDTTRIVEYSPGVMNRLGRILAASVEQLNSLK